MSRSKIRRYVRHGMMPQLAVFEAISRLGSFTRAGEELFMAQPTVSMHMKKLTETLGVTLVEQVGKKLIITDAGRELATACQDIFGRLSAMEDRFTALRDLDHGRLKIAVSSAGKYFVPRLLGGFCAHHPNIDVTMHVDNWQGMLVRMQEFADDLYVLSTPPLEIALVSVPILPNPIEVFARSDHALVARRSIAFKRLADEPFIMREPGSATRRMMQDLFARHAMTPRVRMELASNEAIKQAVLGGLGIALLSRYVVGLDAHNPELRALDIDGFPLMQQWYIVYPAAKRLPKVAGAFVDHVRANADREVLSHLEDTHAAQQGAFAVANKLVR